MTQSWVEPFYRKQFEWMNQSLDMKDAYNKLALEVKEQVGKPFSEMLDIGAGRGDLAKSLAESGVKMTTLELVPELVEFAKERSNGLVTSHCGDFYTFELPDTFDVVSYFDGFGIGTDEDQLLLLHRIYKWMKEDGCALIDIYQPRYWQQVAGREMTVDAAHRVYHYDEQGHRMLDSWWKADHPEEKVTQSLRCYSLEEISGLCEQAGLTIVGIFPGGAMDFEEWRYQECVPLHECLSYRVKVKKIE
ncbi:class I SAM-dependent methyltransferase [Sporosarcina sp. BI001-red]|uniref:class I SAM-dependent methyltransferase n=1 Tax=Sporosarcina sp. BI001-red TaxID=2282866 RepID=UPI000E23A4D0|nr:class I SAM-dependent methyltransferase [Sporosarcina sp. BI001-red]REB05547.1 class I SAM-dependent methyltransferase [Sporosarcina sp. BI001-red]